MIRLLTDASKGWVSSMEELLGLCSVKLVQKRIHFSNHLSFVAQIHIVVCVRDHDDVCAWHALAEVIGSACSVLYRLQSELFSWGYPVSAPSCAGRHR